MNDARIRQINEYVYAKYVDGLRGDPLDENAILAELEAWYSRPENREDAECVYVGILAFELGWGQEDEAGQIEFFSRAKSWLERHKALTGDEWDAVDDRLLDLEEFFAAKGVEPSAVPVEAAPVANGAPAPSPVIEPTFAPVVVQPVEDHGTMMLIPAGAFLFSATREPRSIPAFYIDKYPVTNRQYEAFCRATSYRFPKNWNKEGFNRPDAPVVGVSYSDALKYSTWVGKELPTEEQWEKACRGIDGRRFPWGDDLADETRACFGRDPATGGTDPVTAHEARGASPYGVIDLAGNVWEWTSTSDQDESETIHVIKGGCYNDPPDLLDASVRLGATPKDKFETIGFRCAKSV